jgi:hypothetical protein
MVDVRAKQGWQENHLNDCKEKKPQISPLRYAPVEMTNLLVQ